LKQYNPELLTKEKILAISKCDLVDEELRKMIEKDLKKGLKGKEKITPLYISAATGFGIDTLKDEIMKKLTA
jgi:GTPase